MDADTRVVLEYFRLWAMHRLDDAFDLLGEDFRVWVADRQELSDGQPRREGATDYLERPDGKSYREIVNWSRDRFEEVSVRAGHIVSSGGCVAIELNIAGDTRDGDAVNRQYVFLMIVRQGKLHLMKEYVVNAPAGTTNLFDVDPSAIVDLSSATDSFLDAT
jgi:ketosteroid isomerase-like protein